MRNIKGIVLAGGSGTRLMPITKSVSKQLLPVYDKPLIYYPLSVLMLAGIREIAIITTEDDHPLFLKLLGDGSNFGIKINFIIQKKPEGIAQGLILAEEFIGNDSICFILGDNIFWGHDFSGILKSAISRNIGGTVFGYKVKDPSRFGVIEFDEKQSVVNIEEKPRFPRSNFVATGLYLYDNRAIGYAKRLQPSDRGELEITDVNNCYAKNNELNVELLGRGFAWMDTGTTESLHDASVFVESVQMRQGYKIACLEEIALNNGWLDSDTLRESMNSSVKNSYDQYINELLKHG